MKHRIIVSLSALGLLAALAACGGGGGTSGDPAETPAYSQPGVKSTQLTPGQAGQYFPPSSMYPYVGRKSTKTLYPGMAKETRRIPSDDREYFKTLKLAEDAGYELAAPYRER